MGVYKSFHPRHTDRYELRKLPVQLRNFTTAVVNDGGVLEDSTCHLSHLLREHCQSLTVVESFVLRREVKAPFSLELVLPPSLKLNV